MQDLGIVHTVPVLATAPSSPKLGQTYYDTTLGVQRTWDGTRWSGLLARYRTTVGDGTNTVFTVTHNLGSTAVDVVVRNVATGGQVWAGLSAVAATVNTITLTFATAPASGAFSVLCIA